MTIPTHAPAGMALPRRAAAAGTLRRRAFTTLLAGACAAPALVAAQEAGDALRLIVPLPPGSGGDNVARALAPRLRELLRQPVVIDNRPGGDMAIGASLAAKAAPDGRTLLMGHMSMMVLNPLAYSSLPYEPQRDFVPVGKVSESTAVMVVHPSLPVKTLAEFVAHVRERPGQLSYGTAILMVQVSGENLAHTRRLQMTRVPYKGGAQVMQDTVAGHIQMSIADTSSYIALIRAGKLRPLATTGARRNPLLPDVPTARESGFPEMEMTGWWGLFAPAGTPAAAVSRVNAALQKALAMPEVVAQLHAVGVEPAFLPADALRREMAAQAKHWGEVMKLLKIRGGE